MGHSSLPGAKPAAEVDGAAAPDSEAKEGEEEDESADPVGDGHSDAEAAQREAREGSAVGRRSIPRRR